MTCTCETYGTCQVCRPTLNTDYYQGCAWCEHTFYKDDMFMVGRYEAGLLVCGPDCPKRPERERFTHPDVHEVTVKMRVHDAKSPVHAQNLVNKMLRGRYTDKRTSGARVIRSQKV